MRHRNKLNRLGRTSEHRKALMRNLAIALIEHKRIRTTLAKARSLRQFVEPLITKSKSDTTHNRRVVFSYLQNKEAIKELFGVVSEKVVDRPGGYVRIIRVGFRRGDGSEMAMIELVDFNEDYAAPKAGESTTESGRRRRTRRGKSGTGQTETVNAATSSEIENSARTATEDVVTEVESQVDTNVVPDVTKED
jgi:large subunit ribosomal protein L17